MDMDKDMDLDNIFDVDSLLSALEEVKNEDSKAYSSENDKTNLIGLQSEPIQINSDTTQTKTDSEKIDVSIDDILKDIDDMEEVPEELVYVKSIDDYDRNIYSDFQLKEIEKGINSRVDVSLYDDPEMSGRKMREIRYGLERGLDVSFYANKLYLERQMVEIRRGLQDGLDVTSYARRILSPTDMKEIREQLLFAKHGENDYGSLAYDFDDKETGIHIYVEPGALEAGIVLNKHLDNKFTKHDLKGLMNAYDITEGFVDRELPQNLSNLPVGVKIVVMRGKAPVKGTDGYFEYMFSINDNSPKVNEDGTVNYYSNKDFVSISEGEVLIKYHHATPGTNGKTVTGINLVGKYGNELEPLVSDSMNYDEEKEIYTAKKSGYISLKDGTVNIMDNLVIDRDVSGLEGPISFDGTIIINGSVKDNAEVYATGDIIVNGFVEVAKFNAGGDITISSGTNGDDKGSFIAKNNITAAFCENAFLDAGGNIEVGYLLNCNVNAGGVLKTKGKKALLCGGNIIANKGIEADIIGSRTGTRTYVEVGSTEEESELFAQLEQEKKKIEAENAKINEAIDEIINKVGAMVARKQPAYEKLQAVILGNKEKIQAIKTDIEDVKQKLLERADCVISVKREAYKNTLVCIGGSKLILQEDMKAPVFRCVGRKIVTDN